MENRVVLEFDDQAEFPTWDIYDNETGEMIGQVILTDDGFVVEQHEADARLQ